MKTKVLFLSLIASVIIFSCKRSLQSPTAQNGIGNYRAGFVSKTGDTTWTTTKLSSKTARVETVGLDSAFDNRFKISLISYNGNGVFVLTATNLTTCQGIIRWSWDSNFKIDSIGYASNNPNDPENDVLKAGQTKTFIIYSKQPKPGRLKAQLNSVSNCGNSSSLIINITSAILPITYTNFAVTYNETIGRLFIGFNIMEPTELNWVVIQKLDGNIYKTVLLVPGDDKTNTYNIKLP